MKIKFEKVSYIYNAQLPYKNHVLKDIDLEISEGEFIGLIGSTGSGKTTLLQHFTGLLKPTSGAIYVDDRNIWSENFSLKNLRKKIGLVFQFPESQLFEETVFADIAFGPKSLKLPDQEIAKRVEDGLKLVGLDIERYKNRSPLHLSEGEKRRIAIAGVLAMAPDVLILDEPTACLDPFGIKVITNILKHLHRNGTTIIMSTHNLDTILQVAQRVIALHNGTICIDSSLEKAFSNRPLLKEIGLEIPRILSLSDYLYANQITTEQNLTSLKLIKQNLNLKKRIDPRLNRSE